MQKLTPVALLVMALLVAGAHAEDAATPILSFSGFGTLGLVHSSESKADFTSSIYKATGAGHSHDWSFGVDSLIAAQVTANFTPQISGVLQIVSDQNYDGSYRPQVEWANIKYQFTPDFSVRAGRSVLPPLLFSETRLVAYTYPWVRPPLEVYGLSPITSYDGLDVSYRLHLGDLTNTLRATAGRSDTKLPNGTGATNVRSLREISNTIESGPLTLHVSYQRSYLTIPSINPFFNAFRLFGPQGVALADRYDSDHKLYALFGVGANFDPGPWFLTGEWSRINTHSFIGQRSAWYVSGGFRVGKFTPYVTYARARADNLSDPGLDTAALPPDLAGLATGLNGALNSILSTKVVQNTLTVGGRWDFTKNTALKLQFDHTRIGAGSSGALINIQPGFELGGKVNVFSTTVDFVF